MSKSHDVSREAAEVLSAVDTALRRATDLHWTDPGFLAWEYDQVGDLDEEEIEAAGEARRVYQAYPGPAHARYESNDIGVTDRPMVSRQWNHPPDCLCDQGEMPPGGAMRIEPHDYPPPGETVYGPLLLGPEPPVVFAQCPACLGTGEALDGGECDGCVADADATPHGQAVPR